MSEEKSSSCESVFVARQPVFLSDETVWGYELLFRSGEENIATIADGSQATSSVIADGLTMALDGMDQHARVLINFPEQLLVEDAGFALPKERCVIEILEDVDANAETLAAVRRLKDAGYTIALDDYFGQPELEPFTALADIIKIDILALESEPQRIAEAVKNISLIGPKLLGEKVEDNLTFEVLKDMGFSLFQGFFFSKPEIIPGKKLSTNEMTKLQLLSELSKPDFEPRRLAEILRSDPNLSYRLFRYINSVGFGLCEKVTSLKRAIDMMGMIQAKQWLRTVIMADLNPAPKAGEMAFLAVHRGKFLETICSISNVKGCSPDTMFITGLFSLLDAMLGIKMETVLEQLPLEEFVVNSLTGEGEARGLLDLASSYEHGNWTETLALAERFGLKSYEVDSLYSQSRNWAQRMLGFSKVED